MSNYRFDDESTLRERVKKLPFIKSQKIEWCPLKRNKKYIEMPYPKYNKEILKWIDDFYNLKLVEYNYTENYKNYKEKIIEQLTDEELLSYLTFLIRGERFCDGLIAENLNNGIIEKIEKQLLSFVMDFQEIDEDNIKDITTDNMMFFSLSDKGAMGESCGIEIITKKDNNIELYHTNYEHNIDTKDIYPIDKVLKKVFYNYANNINIGICEHFGMCDMGFGNSLYIRDIYLKEFCEEIKEFPPYIVYTNWLRIALDELNYDWSNIKNGE